MELVMDLEKAYLVQHQASGIKVGDRVRVLRKARSQEQGWTSSWTLSMDECVGREFVVELDHWGGGFGLDTGQEVYSFPWFVLEKIETSTWTYNLHPNLTAIVHPRKRNRVVLCFHTYKKETEKWVVARSTLLCRLEEVLGWRIGLGAQCNQPSTHTDITASTVRLNFIEISRGELVKFIEKLKEEQ